MATLQTIHESFDEKDMSLLRQAKGSMTWKEFILNAARDEISRTNKLDEKEILDADLSKASENLAHPSSQSPDPAGETKSIFGNNTPLTPTKSPSPADDNYKMPDDASKKENNTMAGTPDKPQGISKETEQFISGVFDEDTCRKIWKERHPDIPYNTEILHSPPDKVPSSIHTNTDKELLVSKTDHTNDTLPGGEHLP